MEVLLEAVIASWEIGVEWKAQPEEIQTPVDPGVLYLEISQVERTLALRAGMGCCPSHSAQQVLYSQVPQTK